MFSRVVSTLITLSRDCIFAVQCVESGTGRPLSPRAFTVLAAGPAAGSTLAFFEFFLGATDTTFSSRELFGILDPADEFVASQGRDVIPRRQRTGIGRQCPSQVRGQFVYDAAGHPWTAHGPTLSG